MSCAFCGRENDAESRFCMDCGKPINPSAARVGPAYVPHPSGGQPQPYLAPQRPVRPSASPDAVPQTRVSESSTPCLRCSKPVNPGLPFCGHCGTRVTTTIEESACAQCGAAYTKGVDLFCARCGNDLKQRVSADASRAGGGTEVFGIGRRSTGPQLALIGESRDVIEVYNLERGEAVIGRDNADITFADDHFMSPLHARLDMRDGQLCLRDLGSRNGTWVFIDQPAKLNDCDLVLVGAQLLRFRRLGYPAPHPPEADATRRMGSSIPTADVAVLEQLRADGSVRDVFHLSPGRSVTLGREVGDWIFPYDATMSRRHADIRSEGSEFFVHDANSRNGVAMGVRGERVLNKGQRLLVGNQILRLENV
jgi:pSer/pThr/pTyr-binding forkhead associated (FHA) protein